MGYFSNQLRAEWNETAESCMHVYIVFEDLDKKGQR